jgi:hypothetical protein
MSEESLESEVKDGITTDEEEGKKSGNEVRKVYYDVKLRREGEEKGFGTWIKLMLFGLFLPTIIASLISIFFLPKPDVIYVLFFPIFIVALICLTWFVAFTFIGGKFAKLSWDLFLDKRKGIVLKWFKSNQVEISTGKVDERICFIPGDKLTEQTILEKRMAGSANFMGRPVVLMVQDNNFNVNLLDKFPSDPLNKDYNAAVQNSFDAGVFFNRVFEGNYLKLVLLVVGIVGLLSIISLYFSWNASGQATITSIRLTDINNVLTNIINNQSAITEALKTAPQVYSG